MAQPPQEMTPHGQQDSLFFTKLPPEIRVCIYELVLTVEPGLKGQVTIWRRCRQRETVLKMLKTCRSIYNEAAGILYAKYHLRCETSLIRSPTQGTFQTEDIFLGCLRPNRLQGISALTVVILDADSAVKICDLVASLLPRLRILHLENMKTGDYILDMYRRNVTQLKAAVVQMQKLETLRFIFSIAFSEELRDELEELLRDEVIAAVPNKLVEKEAVEKEAVDNEAA